MRCILQSAFSAFEHTTHLPSLDIWGNPLTWKQGLTFKKKLEERETIQEVQKDFIQKKNFLLKKDFKRNLFKTIKILRELIVAQWCPTLCGPWTSPGRNTRVGCDSLLHGIFLTQGSNPGLLCCSQILYHLSGLAIYSNPRTTHNHLAECQKKSDYHRISTSLYVPTLSLVDKYWHLASTTQTGHPIMLCLQKKANIELFKDTDIPKH